MWWKQSKMLILVNLCHFLKRKKTFGLPSNLSCCSLPCPPSLLVKSALLLLSQWCILLWIISQAPKKAKRRQQQGEGGSSNVFSMFEQSQIQEYKEVKFHPSHPTYFDTDLFSTSMNHAFLEKWHFGALIWLPVSYDLGGNERTPPRPDQLDLVTETGPCQCDRTVNQIFPLTAATSLLG